MGRPKVTAKRDRQLNFSLTAQELTILQTRAKDVGLRLAEYGRRLLLQQPLITGEFYARGIDPKSLHQLMRIGNNLNQIARAMHIHPGVDAPGDLAPLLEALRIILDAEFARDTPHP